MPVDRNDDGVVLLVSSGQRLYREYLLKGLAARAELWLIDEHPATWQRPYLAGGTVVTLRDAERMVPDEPALLDAALKIAQQRKIVGVVTYDEIFVIAAARIAEQLGVPGLTVAGAQNCRDKRRSRELLTAAGLPQPAFALVHTESQAASAAAHIGYPVVLKPRGLGASVGVVKVTGPSGLPAGFAVVDRARHAGPPGFADGILVEELVNGPEISVNAAISGDDYRPFCLARKRLGHPPSFEEVGHLVNGADELAADPGLRSVLADTHQALGVSDGVTHTEVRLTPHGPVVIEVNARLGGDLIPFLGQVATGVDAGQVAADIALGRVPETEPRARTCAAIRFLYPPADCRVLDVSVPEPAQPPGLLMARAMVPAGTIVRLPPRSHLGRYAFLIASADSPAACEDLLDKSCAAVRLESEPLEDPQSFAGRPW